VIEAYLEGKKDSNTSTILEKKKSETFQTYIALKHLQDYRKEALDEENDPRNAVVLHGDIVKEVHSKLMASFGKNEGDYRHKEACTLQGDGTLHFYTDHRLISGLMDGLYDIYNQMLLNLDEKSSLFYKHLFNLAAWILYNFVDIHSFSDGNGRTSRLLANHVLSWITPFPVAIYHRNKDRNAVDDYIDAIISCRKSRSGKPCDLVAMIVESAWFSWKELFQVLEERSLLYKEEMIGYAFISKELKDKQCLKRKFELAVSS